MKKIRYIVLRLHVKILLKISGFLSQIKLMQVSNCGYSTVKSKIHCVKASCKDIVENKCVS